MAANASGKTLEGVIFSTLKNKGLSPVPQCDLGVTSIFGKRIRVDFLIEPCVRVPNGLIIESKWQDVAGSAEEKFPYLVLNIKQRYPYPAIIIADGNGASAGAIFWIRDQVDGEHLLAVYSIAEFLSYCNRKL